MPIVRGAASLALVVLVLGDGCAVVDHKFLRSGHIEDVGAVGASKIVEGSNVVLLLREWTPGKIFTTDDERYRKLTIELSSVVVGEPLRVGEAGMKVVVSDGSSVWKRGRCGSETGEGTVVVKEYDESELTADLDLRMECRYARIEIPTGSVLIQGTFRFRRIDIDEMTPWLDGGVTGAALYER